MFQSSLRPSTISAQDLERVQAVARRMFEQYDRDRSSSIENYEVTSMMQDTYRIMSRSFTPTQNDVDGYVKVLDRNGDGRITYQDIEALVSRYLIGEQFTIGAPMTTSSNLSVS